MDTSAKLPDGTRFEGHTGLQNLVVGQQRKAFARQVVTKMLTYALIWLIVLIDTNEPATHAKAPASGSWISTYALPTSIALVLMLLWFQFAVLEVPSLPQLASQSITGPAKPASKVMGSKRGRAALPMRSAASSMLPKGCRAFFA